jgi:hypothetical protein
MTAAAVQTSAHAHHAPESDLFGAPIFPLLQVTGRIKEDAQVRIQANDHGHARPVVCFDLVDVGPCHQLVHIEWPFENAHRMAADAAKLRLTRNTVVTVEAPLHRAVLTLPNATSVTPLTASNPPTTKSH